MLTKYELIGRLIEAGLIDSNLINKSVYLVTPLISCHIDMDAIILLLEKHPEMLKEINLRDYMSSGNRDYDKKTHKFPICDLELQ